MSIKNLLKKAGVIFGYYEPTADEMACDVIADIRFHPLNVLSAVEIFIHAECGGIVGNEFLEANPINNTVVLSLWLELARTGVIEINPDHIKVENIAYDIVNVLK